MAQMLTAKQVAEVKGCSYQYVKRILQEGKLQAIETVNSRNRKIYQIPLEALPEELQQRWYQMQKEQMAEGAVPADQEPEQEQPDRYSEAERKEMDFWIGLIRKWQEYRCMAPSGSKAEVDQKFIAWCSLEYPDRNISLDILYRKWKSVREDDLSGLIDKRGKWRKGSSAINETVWQTFLYYYLDESQRQGDPRQ